MDKNIKQPTLPPAEIKKEVEQERRINKKLLSIVLLLVLILFTVGTYLFSQNRSVPEVAVAPTTTVPKAESTATWKTYTNTNFSIQYPSTLEYKEVLESKSVIFSPEGTNRNIPLRNIWIELYDNPQNLSVTDFIKNNINPNATTQSYTLNNVNGVMLNAYQGGDHKTLSSYAFDYKGQIYTISLNEYPSPISNSPQTIQDDIFSKIVSTFKFTDSTTLDTSTWKTHTSSANGYSFTYPDNWILRENLPSNSVSVSTGLPGGELYQFVSIGVINNHDDLSIEDYVKNFRTTVPTSFTKISINNYPAEKAVIPGQCAGDDNVFIKKSGKIYEIQWPGGKGCRGDKVTSDIFNKILSGFKFTK